MPYNPSTSRAECNYHAGLVNQDSKNQPQTSNRESYNTFDKRHSVADTQLFDEVRPFYMNQANSGDVKRARMVNNDWSPVTKSQILTDIKKHRALFQVPWSVLMPNTWEYLYREPVQGEDINWLDVAPLISISVIKRIIGGIFDVDDSVGSASGATPLDSSIEGLIKRVWLFYNMFGASGIPNTLGCRIFGESFFDFNRNSDSLAYDATLDFSPSSVFNRLCVFLSGGMKINVANTAYTISILNSLFSYLPDSVLNNAVSTDRYSFKVITTSEAFNFIRDFIWYSKSGSLSCLVNYDSSMLGGSDTNPDKHVFNAIANFIFYGVSNYDTTIEDIGFSQKYKLISDKLDAVPEDFTYNLMPVLAYQSVWHQFFTNDRIDPVYSASAFAKNMLSAVYALNSASLPTVANFTVNGVTVPYDYCSAALISNIFTTTRNFGNVAWLDYFNEIFSMRPSMRGSDYFTSMRTQPLAVGNVDVTINANKVSAIDINQSLWYQRFLNAVNRTKQSIYDYLQSITGVLPQRREPQPNFIAEEVFNIAGVQIDNNAENQGSIVSILRNSQSNYIYDIFIDEPSFIIGVDSYSCNFVYPDSSNRISLMSDRLDWFNDFMQHIGDQDVKAFELFTPADSTQLLAPIGYQLRYAEFKNMISRAAGGFLVGDTDLASWLMLYEPYGSKTWPTVTMQRISPYFIRNHCSDFDKFFGSLTGANPSNRYHVIKYTYIDEIDNSKQQSYPSLL